MFFENSLFLSFKPNFLGAVFEVQYEKAEFCHFSVKKVQNYTLRNLEIGHMHFFIRIKFLTQTEAFPLLQDANNYIYSIKTYDIR